MAKKTRHEMIDEVRFLLRKKLGVRGSRLDVQLRKAGRLLPRPVRQDVTYLVEALQLESNPKLARLIDDKRFAGAYRSVVAHLETIDRRRQRITAALNLAAAISVALIATAVIAALMMKERGLI